MRNVPVRSLWDKSRLVRTRFGLLNDACVNVAEAILHIAPVRKSPTCVGQISPGEDRVLEDRVVQDRVRQVRFRQVRVGEVGSGQVRAFPVDARAGARVSRLAVVAAADAVAEMSEISWRSA